VTGEDQITAVRVRIEGRVQGVWFRGWTVQRAADLKLQGWVRNRSDGSVEALFAGPADAVALMLQQCWDGPPGARVTDVRAEPAEAPQRAGFFAVATL
jgi:acylphosphatase